MDKYCICCGRLSEDIMKELNDQKPDVLGVKRFGYHTLYSKTGYYYHSLLLRHCGNCGKILDDEEIHTISENRGECHGFPSNETIVRGYHCYECGYKEVF